MLDCIIRSMCSLIVEILCIIAPLSSKKFFIVALVSKVKIPLRHLSEKVCPPELHFEKPWMVRAARRFLHRCIFVSILNYGLLLSVLNHLLVHQ